MSTLNLARPASVATHDVLTENHVLGRAMAYLRAYPDIYEMARSAAQQILFKHTGQRLDPDAVYWHRFSHADTSSATFTGWEHPGPPTESIKLIDLVMTRFSVGDQANTDLLNLYGGFYQGGAEQSMYNEKNEVKMLPSDVLRDFWALDFASHCHQAVDTFWRDFSDDFCRFAKAQMLAFAGMAFCKRQITVEDFHTVLAATTGKLSVDVPWEDLAQHNVPPAGVTIQRLQLAGIEARTLLHIRNAAGRQIICWPGAHPMFYVFANESALHGWVLERIAGTQTRSALIADFYQDKAQADRFQGLLLQHSIHPTFNGRPFIGPAGDGGDVFEDMRQRAWQEMTQNMQNSLTSNSSLRKQMWLGDISALAQSAGVFAPIWWPLAVVAFCAGVAAVGLYSDQAVNGRTRELRRAGVRGALLNGMYLFLNLPALASIGAASRVKPIVPGSLDGLAEASASLEGLEGNEVLVGALSASGRTRGIHVLANGETWITLNNLPYRVRYLNDLQTWAIVDPENPFAFHSVRPVRLNSEGQWEQVPMPRLHGGVPMEAGAAGQPYVTTNSPFWDIYMQTDLEAEEHLSQVADERQEGVLDLYQATSDEPVISDSEGEETVTDSTGERHHVFKSAGGTYYGGFITRYSHDSDAFNVFLRTGERRVENQIDILMRLSDDLDVVRFNNDVPLYRGGSSARGTSGKMFREGKFKPGDVLVNTDFTSFSENPYIARVFASSEGHPDWEPGVDPVTFDDTSVVFELPAKKYLSARPISPFSNSVNEAESLFPPGNYFEIQRIEEVTGEHYRFMNVELMEIPLQQVKGVICDMRTGLPFNREQYAAMLGDDAGALVKRFFPVAS